MYAWAGAASANGFAELLTRWLELAAFQPIDRDHAAKSTREHEPWIEGLEQEAIRRHDIEQRDRLMPYLYTAAKESSGNGVPILRRYFLNFRI